MTSCSSCWKRNDDGGVVLAAVTVTEMNLAQLQLVEVVHLAEGNKKWVEPVVVATEHLSQQWEVEMCLPIPSNEPFPPVEANGEAAKGAK